MNLEVYFTPHNSESEIPFTISTGRTANEIYLYSIQENSEYKFPLSSENGQLRLVGDNPFREEESLVTEKMIGLSSEWMEYNSQGFENSADFKVSGKPGYGPDDIFVENKPFSLRQIVDLINSQDIELTPDFQRNFIWDRTRQSKLIESILLGLPLPSIYLSQYEDGRLTVVDGLQRLHTIKNFLENKLILNNLEYLENCNGKKYSQLEGILSPLRLRKFGQTQIMCFVIDYRSPSQLKFDLFRRLNTGGRPLNNQEIRNCLSRPHVQNLLKRMTELESFDLATDYSVRDTRMESREAALRFIYFYDNYSPKNPIGNYNGDMESALDSYIDILNKRDPSSLEKYISIYDNSLTSAFHLFDIYCFRKILPETLGDRRAPVNKLLMLTISVLLSNYDSARLLEMNENDSLIELLADYIEEDYDFFRAMSYGTNGKWNIETGYNALTDFFENNLIY